MNHDNRATVARKGLWSYTFEEMIEIIDLILSANYEPKEFKEYGLPLPSNRTKEQAIATYMQQLLGVKCESVFGKRGGSSNYEGKEVSSNKDTGDACWATMKEFADNAVENSQVIRKLLNRLQNERHRFVAHREGGAADFTHEPDGRSMVFKANPDPIAAEDLKLLRAYFDACKQFCDRA